MKRLVFFLVLVGVLGLVSGGSAATPVVAGWGNAIEMPGATLNSGQLAIVNSVSCAAAGRCTAGGSYNDGSAICGPGTCGAAQAFVVDETNGVWGSAIEVPGTAALNSGRYAQVSSVSCATVGNCAAGGYYQDGSGKIQAFVVSETNGVWGNAVEVPGTATLNSGGEARLSSVSCATAGNCAAGGYYTDGSGNQQAFVVDETNSVWGSAIEVPGTAALNSGGAQVSTVSCATAGNCAAGGYTDGSGICGPGSCGAAQAFVVDETNGVWGNAIEVPGLAFLNSGDSAQVSSVSCATAGNCTAGGYYSDHFGNPGPTQAFVVDETNGVWGSAIEVPGTATLNSGGSAQVSSVSCATVGNCAAGGYYEEGAFVVSETNGVWGSAIEVPGTATLNSGGAEVSSVSCATAGNCAAGGLYEDDYSTGRAFVVNETNGSWGNAVEVSGTASPSSDRHAWVSSVSCGAVRDCAAGGTYDHLGQSSFNEAQGFVVTCCTYSVVYTGNGATAGSAPSDGSSPYPYGTTVTVLGAGSLTRTGYKFNGWNTAANGSGTSYRAGGTFSMPASAVTLYAQWAKYLSTATTTCKGTYAGTGSNVLVPALATCTLVPGTHVNYNVTVKPGGTLHVSGVTIGGTLSMSGSATVCGSKIGLGVTATGGLLMLGGPGCAGNTISGNVVVHNDAKNVWVWGNTVKTGHGLTVKYGTGGTDSIASNIVSGGLLVEYSGPPVEVSKNHAATARCVNNKGQTGSGNHATGTNTCPH